MWRVGIDVGGTFTDLYARNEQTGEERTGKVLTTPQDRTLGVLNSIEAAGIACGEIKALVHGTTTATNALLERTFPDAAMITTEGFRDVLEIGRMHREHLYRPYQTKPPALIKRRHRFTIDERTGSDGAVRKALPEQKASEVIAQIAKTGVKSVLICFLNSYVNPQNERAMAEMIRKALPEVIVVTSSEVKPVLREHTRFSTAAVRAVLLPVMAAYFERLEGQLHEAGFRGSLVIMKSNGGIMTVGQAKTRVEELVESGPAGGVAYAAQLAGETGARNIIHTDMGGTSFDTSIIENGHGLITREYEIEFDIPVAVPMLDIRSVGAGGGSIGWIDAGGALRVGPASAGSTPGPACYGRGGENATITDANLVLGRLNPDLAGKFTLDVEASRRVVKKLADAVGLTIEQCAEGMIRIATEAMAQAVKIVLTSRGRDPRDYALASFGGAGPMHAYFVAAALGIPQVINPTYSGVASAFGATVSQMRHDEEAFFHGILSADLLPPMQAVLADLAGKAERALAEQGIERDSMAFEYVLRSRYAGQTFEIDTPVLMESAEARDIAAIEEAFHQQHESEFGVRSDEFPIEIMGVAVSATSHVAMTYPDRPAEKAEPAALAEEISRPVFFNGAWHETKIVPADNLNAKRIVDGPALVDYRHTCAVIPPGGRASLDDRHNLILDVEAA